MLEKSTSCHSAFVVIGAHSYADQVIFIVHIFKIKSGLHHHPPKIEVDIIGSHFVGERRLHEF